MFISVINVDVTNKGKFSVAEVTYKDGDKTQVKKLVSFGANEKAFKVLSSAKKGDAFTIATNKNPDGYWDWTDVVIGDVTNKDKASPAPRSGNYETPEERYFKQECITRQHGVTSAINILSHQKKSFDIAEVLTLAEAIAQYSLGRKEQARGFAGIQQMEDDVPL